VSYGATLSHAPADAPHPRALVFGPRRLRGPAGRAGAEGWVREHSGALTAVIVNGRQVWPVALISDSHETDSRPDLAPYAER
jgi:hypothetical protein